jgi:Protein of unknown function (DUF751)
MDFWDNLLRYPRFFLSSMLGLALVLASPLIRISKEIQNKRILFSLFLISALILVWILVLMTNPPD